MAIYHEDPEGMAKYLPKMYYGEVVDQYSVFMEGHSIKMKKDSEMAIIVIENLFQNMTNISWLDLKLGQIIGSRKSYFADIEGYIKKSKERNYYENCYMLVEHHIRDPQTNETISYDYKNYTIDMNEVYTKFFTDSSGNISAEALNSVCDQISNIIEYFSTTLLENDYKDMSTWLLFCKLDLNLSQLTTIGLLVILDHKSKIYKTHLIDLNHMYKLMMHERIFPLVKLDENGVMRDNAIIKGLENIQTKFRCLLDKQ